MKEDNKEPYAALAPLAERLMASRKQGLPSTGSDFASLQKTMSPGSLASPIPTATASVRTDAPEVVKETIAATTPERPAPPVDGSGGDDDVRNLYLARLAAQSAAGFGGMGAGKNIDMGIADTLGERLKQVQALRAKREEQSLEQQRERSTWGASNRGTLAGYIARFKDRPEVVAALKDMEPAADTTKPGDFNRNVIGAITTPGKVAGMEAGVAKTNVQIPDIQAGTGVKIAKAADIGLSANTRDDLRRSQIDLNKARIDHMGAKKESESAPASTTGPLADPRLEQRRQDTFSKVTRGAQKLYTDPLIAVASLEKASGPLAKGETPEWWTPANIIKINSGIYGGLPPEATAFAKTYFPVINQLRHALYGSALSAGEQAAFANQIELGLKQGPKALAASIRALADAAKDKTQTQLGYDFGRNPDLAAQWLQSSHFNDKVKGTSLEDTFAEYAKAPAAAGASVAKKMPSARSIEALKKNPDAMTRQQFDEAFGPGSAAAALGE
jgi:hypothetical protein